MTESVGGRSGLRSNISNISEAINIIQVNAQHARQAQMNLNNWIDKQKQGKYLMLIQEPYIYKQKAAMQPKTANKYTGGNGKSPRTCIYARPGIPIWYLDQLSEMQRL